MHQKSLSLLLILFLLATTEATRNEWSTQHRNQKNDRMVKHSPINSDNVANLVQKWVTPTVGWPTTNPSLFHDYVIVGDAGGYIHALSKKSGTMLWRVDLSRITGYDDEVSFGTPAIHKDLVIITATYSRYLIAINLYTGRVFWKKQVGSYEDGVLPSSPTIVGDKVFVGTSCWNWSPNYIGEVFCLDVLTGNEIWSIATIGEDGFGGAPVSSNTFAVDHVRGLLYFGTGDPTRAPDYVVDCINFDWFDQSCIPKDVRVNSVIALRISNAEIVWSTPMWPAYLLDLACNNTIECYPSETFIFEASPLLSNDALVISQSGGFTFRLDPNHGNVMWFTQSSPGGVRQGGAADGEFYYVPERNPHHDAWFLEPPEESYTQGGFWSVINLNGGDVVAQKSDPYAYEQPFVTEPAAPPTLINDLVIFPSTAPEGPVHFVSKDFGLIVHTLHTGASNFQGVAAFGSCIYVAVGADPDINENYIPDGSVVAYCLR